MKLFFIQLLILNLNLFSIFLFSQNPNISNFKSEALQLISEGRYGEAIDVLNKYVSANPNSADGFNLRGICYEKRGNYEYAVYDFNIGSTLEMWLFFASISVYLIISSEEAASFSR